MVKDVFLFEFKLKEKLSDVAVETESLSEFEFCESTPRECDERRYHIFSAGGLSYCVDIQLSGAESSDELFDKITDNVFLSKESFLAYGELKEQNKYLKKIIRALSNDIKEPESVLTNGLDTN